MLFSATVTKGVRKITSKFTKDPHQVIINSKNITLDKIKQKVIQTSNYSKQDALCKILDEENPFMAIIFCNTKQRARSLTFALSSLGYNCEELEGDMLQSKRKKVIKKFRDLKLQLLIATDIAARGLDIEGVTHIINYDMPPNAENYIHRIGRTGRAGQEGVAITFATSDDTKELNLIEAGIKVKLERRKINKDELPETKQSFNEEKQVINRTQKWASKSPSSSRKFTQNKRFDKKNKTGKNVKSKKIGAYTKKY
jgi:ATP-dependent RNA helicase DeaD